MTLRNVAPFVFAVGVRSVAVRSLNQAAFMFLQLSVGLSPHLFPISTAVMTVTKAALFPAPLPLLMSGGLSPSHSSVLEHTFVPPVGK